MSATQIRKALSKIKYGKPAGPSDIIAKVLRVAGEERIELVRQQV